MMKVAIGSHNPVKIEAVKRVFDYFFDAVEYVEVNSPAGVSEMPMSDEEAIKGAQNRAIYALEDSGADYGCGLEGNVEELGVGMILRGIVVIVNKQGEYGIGDSGGLLLPEYIADRIRNGEELGPVMDHIVKDKDTKKKMGAVGIFTKGYVPRVDGFERGVAFAISRFINSDMFIN